MNTNTTAVIGLGALGTLLAYYGYQYLDEEESENVSEDYITMYLVILLKNPLKFNMIYQIIMLCKKCKIFPKIKLN